MKFKNGLGAPESIHFRVAVDTAKGNTGGSTDISTDTVLKPSFETGDSL